MIEIVHRGFFGKIYFSLSLLHYGAEKLLIILAMCIGSVVVSLLSGRKWILETAELLVKFLIPFHVFFKLSNLFIKNYSKYVVIFLIQLKEVFGNIYIVYRLHPFDGVFQSNVFFK